MNLQVRMKAISKELTSKNASTTLISPKKKTLKEDKDFLKFLDMFKKREINVPFVQALTEMP